MNYKILAVVGLCGALLSPALGEANAEEGPIRIGSFLAVTGKGAFLGDPSKKVLESFVERVNSEGGVQGRPIELVLYDSRTDAKEAVNFVRRLISQDEVDIIIGGNTTGETMAVAPFVERAEIPFISLGGGSVIIDPVKPWVFKTPHTDRISVERILAVAKAEGGKALAVLSGPGGFDQSCRSNVQDLVQDFGVDLVSDQQHGAGDSDMTAQMTTIRRSGANFMIYCGFGAPTSIVAKNHDLLIPNLPLYMTVGAASQDFVSGADGAAEGVRVTASALLVPDQLSKDDPQYDVTTSFVSSYRDTFGAEPSTFAGHAHDALLIALDAIERAGSTDPDEVRNAIETVDGLPGLNGIYRMSPTNHMGLQADSLRIVEVQNGRFALID